MSEEETVWLRFYDDRYYPDIFKVDWYEDEHGIAPQHPRLLYKDWYEFKQELLDKAYDFWWSKLLYNYNVLLYRDVDGSLDFEIIEEGEENAS